MTERGEREIEREGEVNPIWPHKERSDEHKFLKNCMKYRQDFMDSTKHDSTQRHLLVVNFNYTKRMNKLKHITKDYKEG